MARFTAQVDVAAPVDVTWAVLVDWPEHGKAVPLTEVRVLTPSGEGVGARFVARSGVGPVGFDDPMEVVEWRPPQDGLPARCAVVKQGRLVIGTAAFEVDAAPGGSRVTWVEDIEIAPVALTRPFARVVSAAGRFAFTRALRALGAQAQRRAAAHD